MAEQAKSKRTEAKRQFTRCVNILEDTLERNDIFISTINRRFSDLKTRFEETQKTHDAYVVLLNIDTQEQEDKWIIDISKKYYDIELQYDTYINKRSVENTQIEPKNILQTESIIKAEPEAVSKGKFEGDNRRFPRFKQDFNCYIKPLCNEDQLPLVLKSYTVQ